VKPASFEYHRPESAEHAVRLLAALGDDAKLLAGGQSLVPMLALRITHFENLIEVGSPSRCRKPRGCSGLVGAPGQAGLFAFEAGRAHPFADRRWWRWSGPAGLAQFLVGEGVAFDGLLEESLEQQSAAA
jgi:hypothetical protein